MAYLSSSSLVRDIFREGDLWKQVEEQLKNNGWSKDKSYEGYKQDVIFRGPETLKHKYFTIWYDYI